ncbi:Kinesin-like protein KLP6 [Mizuhopecten yessoensis]|uniref:Kinesin-like protein 6 n=1 Tax=Mizuhopecten yessoensis TaxID=6573 RepID=A0A210PLV4_MIZYE|nr:Kinesin-like protein KLP6 [Mizuhopecten yessoensis]
MAEENITDPSGSDEPRKFTFDFSYWSHDGCKENNGYYEPDPSQPNGKKFADQKSVYNDLGVGVLENAWGGYNSTLFAYGQTGSGKSWSMVGYGVNKGVVPLFCDNIFQQITEKKNSGDKTEFEVTFSMLEIYNEQVRDLLTNSSARGGLKVRQHPKQGFYADGLKVVPVNSYDEISKKMAEGTTNRTVASTNMNATSSRAHTIVGITFQQIFINPAGEKTTKAAVVNLVDLAGSERAESTGATGDRLKEGAAINQSLSCLGNCIAALAEKSSGKNCRVPYRDSVLTKLLKNALGGNSKTIMIAALSPADVNFDETLSTLRYADRAKQIKTTASVNESPTDKLIRELQEENEKLKLMIESGNYEMIKQDDDDDDLTDEEKKKEKEDRESEYASMLEKNKHEMEEMKKTFEERLAERGDSGTDFNAVDEKKKTTPHLYNLNQDPQLSGRIVHFLEGENITIGSCAAEGDVNIRIVGPSIHPKHASFSMAENKWSIEPAAPHSRILHNGKGVGNKEDLVHNDRLQFGTTQFFVYCNPKERDSSKINYPDISYDDAQQEVARKSGLGMDKEAKSRDEALLQEEMVKAVPAVQQANSISEELDKKLKFELIVVSPEGRGETKGRSIVMVKVTHLETKFEWMWPFQKLLNRMYVMQEMYDELLEGENVKRTEEEDPFFDDMKCDFYIGSVKIWLKSMAYLIESKDQLSVCDYQGKEVGILNYEILPCDSKGKEYTDSDDIFVEIPDELLGRPDGVHFKLKITSARGLPMKFVDVYAKYTFFNEDRVYETKRLPATNNPDWKYEMQHDQANVALPFLDYLKDGAIMIQIWGKQKIQKSKKHINTKDALLSSSLTKGKMGAGQSKAFDTDKVKYMMEAAFLRKRQERLEQKLHAMKKMLDEAEKHNKKKISTSLIKQIYNASTADAADKCIALIPQEKDDDDEEDDAKPSAAPAAVVKGGEKEGKKKDKDSSSESSDSSDSDSDKEKEKDPEKEKKKEAKRLRKAAKVAAKQKEKTATKNQSKLVRQNTQGKIPIVKKEEKKSSACILL